MRNIETIDSELRLVTVLRRGSGAGRAAAVDSVAAIRAEANVSPVTILSNPAVPQYL